MKSEKVSVVKEKSENKGWVRREKKREKKRGRKRRKRKKKSV